jgi:hypothetical protein
MWRRRYPIADDGDARTISAMPNAWWSGWWPGNWRWAFRYRLTREHPVEAHNLRFVPVLFKVAPGRSVLFGVDLLAREETAAPQAETSGDKRKDVARDDNARITGRAIKSVHPERGKKRLLRFRTSIGSAFRPERL